MNSGIKALLIFALAYLILICVLTLSEKTQAEIQYIENIECIKAGGTYGPISDFDRRLVCNK